MYKDSFRLSNTIRMGHYGGHHIETLSNVPETTYPWLSSDILSHPAQAIQESNNSFNIYATPTSLSNQLTRFKPVLNRQRIRSDFCSRINIDIMFPSLDPSRQKLLEYILNTDWYRDNDPEPRLGSPEANDILFCLDIFHSASFPSSCIKTGRSLYALLTDPSLYKCLMCGSAKSSAQRAVECVRSHIRHKPFKCGGWSSGCGICRAGRVPMRFSSGRLLREHEQSAERRIVCEACGAELCRKGLRRHWNMMHKELPFPSIGRNVTRVRDTKDFFAANRVL
ncbi:hypothetical protein CPB86DRAFT_226964 [Serendipita vermifera]|nr:hypothetical protein CPB86DRAFT_226964 [Serendipita vermifera]